MIDTDAVMNVPLPSTTAFLRKKTGHTYVAQWRYKPTEERWHLAEKSIRRQEHPELRKNEE